MSYHRSRDRPVIVGMSALGLTEVGQCGHLSHVRELSRDRVKAKNNTNRRLSALQDL